MRTGLKCCLVCLGLLLFSTTGCARKIPYSDDYGRFNGDFQKPEQVLAFLQAVPKDKERIELAEKSYAYARAQSTQIHLGKTWGAAEEGSMESIIAYPTGKTFLLLIEGYLKGRDEAARNPATSSFWDAVVEGSVDRAIGLFDSAIAVEAYESSLDDEQRRNLVTYRDYLKRYRDTGEAESDCISLQWVTGGEAGLLLYMNYRNQNHKQEKTHDPNS
ncbi:hypothetical protein AGMMS49545_18870 [Betaproteobacteria bacterium]|nr:hypothetical protein AGMMS49545_18870 [Betaproteobacteria bacterium]GHU39994.1 hypothetical protein AGMMS50289_00830 [Betaproteobacteria bacterium]